MTRRRSTTLFLCALAFAACATTAAHAEEAKEGNAAAPGIQWFATLDPALALAERTGRPILFLSAAPHCGGVPGVW